jgi:hypothetical protein
VTSNKRTPNYKVADLVKSYIFYIKIIFIQVHMKIYDFSKVRSCRTGGSSVTRLCSHAGGSGLFITPRGPARLKELSLQIFVRWIIFKIKLENRLKIKNSRAGCCASLRSRQPTTMRHADNATEVAWAVRRAALRRRWLGQCGARPAAV